MNASPHDVGAIASAPIPDTATSRAEPDPWPRLHPYWTDDAQLEPRRTPIATTTNDLGPTTVIRWHQAAGALYGFAAGELHGCYRLPVPSAASSPVDVIIATALAPMPEPPDHVLVVDEEAVIADLIRDVLEDAGYRVTCRPSPPSPQAVAALAPDVIITELVFVAEPHDVAPPWGDGASLASAVPVIVCSTAVDRLETMAEMRATCGHAALAKPFNVDDLLALVAARCRGRDRQSRQVLAD